jgi:hypothetical protein
MGLFSNRYTVRFEHTVVKQTKTADSITEERRTFAFDGELTMAETQVLLHQGRLVHQEQQFTLLPPASNQRRLK